MLGLFILMAVVIFLEDGIDYLIEKNGEAN